MRERAIAVPPLELPRVVVVAMPITEAIDVVGTLDIFLLANHAPRRGGRPAGYAVEVVTTLRTPDR